MTDAPTFGQYAVTLAFLSPILYLQCAMLADWLMERREIRRLEKNLMGYQTAFEFNSDNGVQYFEEPIYRG